MNKPKINYIVDFVSFIVFLIVSVTGLVLFFFLPSGVRQGIYQEFIGIRKYLWLNWHSIAGFIIIFLVLIHLILHRKWIVSMTKNFFRKRTKKR
jgi:hypothetical protein